MSSVITEMIYAFVDFVNGGVRIAVVGDVFALVALVEVIITGWWVVAVVFESAVSSVRHRVVVVGAVLIHDVTVGFQLPQRILRVDRAAVVRVGVAVLCVGHVNTFNFLLITTTTKKKKEKNSNGMID